MKAATKVLSKKLVLLFVALALLNLGTQKTKVDPLSYWCEEFCGELKKETWVETIFYPRVVTLNPGQTEVINVHCRRVKDESPVSATWSLDTKPWSKVLEVPSVPAGPAVGVNFPVVAKSPWPVEVLKAFQGQDRTTFRVRATPEDELLVSDTTHLTVLLESLSLDSLPLRGRLNSATLRLTLFAGQDAGEKWSIHFEQWEETEISHSEWLPTQTPGRWEANLTIDLKEVGSPHRIQKHKNGQCSYLVYFTVTAERESDHLRLTQVNSVRMIVDCPAE